VAPDNAVLIIVAGLSIGCEKLSLLALGVVGKIGSKYSGYEIFEYL